ncbi:GNAT family N-acetyltransferase [Parafrankia elaeagni]|uniref:GNAT family N-acetyltransferase n=1 Tax=Parafrankia elaeagni TaxID=222534 RepID=UPI0003A616F2|nr:GNAT family N-acetyltransferase [Parafrankia elaeagni]
MPPPTPLIRPFLPADVDAVVALSLRAWAPVFASFEHVLGRVVYRRLYPDWRRQQAEAVREVLSGGRARCWVAESDGRPVGFVAVVLTRESDGPESDCGEIEMIAVDPADQRRGVGAALLDRGIEHIREAGRSLAVIGTGGDPGHAPARRAYERAGFRPLPQVRYYKTI